MAADSALTDRFTPMGEIDVLVELAPDLLVGYIGTAAPERKLAPLFGGRIRLGRVPDVMRTPIRNHALVA